MSKKEAKHYDKYDAAVIEVLTIMAFVVSIKNKNIGFWYGCNSFNHTLDKSACECKTCYSSQDKTMKTKMSISPLQQIQQIQQQQEDFDLYACLMSFV
jgi:hypothetical protein